MNRHRQQLDQITGLLLDAALDVHTILGPGLFESVYEACLARELQLRGAKVERQVVIPIEYKGIRIDAGYRIDLLVEDCVVAELKTVSKLLPIHNAQLLSYLRLGRFPVGLLVNFHVPRLRDGVKRMVNNF